MLQATEVSNSIMDFGFGHFSSSCCFWSKSFIEFFYAFFCFGLLMEKTATSSFFLFEFQTNFFGIVIFILGVKGIEFVQKFFLYLTFQHVMHCAIWYHLYNLKNVKNTVYTPPCVFFTFFK